MNEKNKWVSKHEDGWRIMHFSDDGVTTWGSSFGTAAEATAFVDAEIEMLEEEG